jgi:hypothetical protein
MFSGGVCSWAAAKRVVERHGKEGVVLLFADTKMEDEDLYRFLDEAAENVGAPLVKIEDGRTPWQVMSDQNVIGNSRIAPCTSVLKRRLLNKWRDANCDPATTTIHFGMGWDEEHRLHKVQKLTAPWQCSAPMCERPLMDKAGMFKWLKREGIKAPRLYAMGFPHNNCGGFCVKAGQAHFALLLRVMPERYAWHESQEESLRARVGNHSVLRDRSGDKSSPVSLKEFRERIQAQGTFDAFDWGGCGCAVDA